jgi:hypothetical protein
MKMEILHVYGQGAWHDPVHLIGTKTALTKLAAAIQKAINEGSAEEKDFFTNDGEGYDITIATADEETAEYLSSPYSEECATDFDYEGRIKPEELLERDQDEEVEEQVLLEPSQANCPNTIAESDGGQ